MKKVEFNNIEENKFIMGYIHYKNNKNKLVYKKAIGYIVPEENLVFCISSHNFNNANNNLEDLMYERTELNENLYISQTNQNVFEIKKYIYPNSSRKVSNKVMGELIPLLEKYVLDEDFDLNEKLVEDYKNDTSNNLKKDVKQLILHNVSTIQ